jgi:hypothetical protein
LDAIPPNHAVTNTKKRFKIFRVKSSIMIN